MMNNSQHSSQDSTVDPTISNQEQSRDLRELFETDWRNRITTPTDIKYIEDTVCSNLLDETNLIDMQNLNDKLIQAEDQL